MFVLKRDVKLQLTNYASTHYLQLSACFVSRRILDTRQCDKHADDAVLFVPWCQDGLPRLISSIAHDCGAIVYCQLLTVYCELWKYALEGTLYRTAVDLSCILYLQVQLDQQSLYVVASYW